MEWRESAKQRLIRFTRGEDLLALQCDIMDALDEIDSLNAQLNTNRLVCEHAIKDRDTLRSERDALKQALLDKSGSDFEAIEAHRAEDKATIAKLHERIMNDSAAWARAYGAAMSKLNKTEAELKDAITMRIQVQEACVVKSMAFQLAYDLVEKIKCLQDGIDTMTREREAVEANRVEDRKYIGQLVGERDSQKARADKLFNELNKGLGEFCQLEIERDRLAKDVHDLKVMYNKAHEELDSREKTIAVFSDALAEEQKATSEAVDVINYVAKWQEVRNRIIANKTEMFPDHSLVERSRVACCNLSDAYTKWLANQK
jgi:chromosome segregation ATPase